MKRYYCYIFLLFTSIIKVEGSHLSGAQLYYDYFGNNQYEFTLVEYINYPNGFYNTTFGDPEYVQIFDSAGNYIDSLALVLPPPDTLQIVNNVSCFSTPNYFLAVAVYHGVITLPPIAGGYIAVFQKCCRNSAITNIPNNIGATYVSPIGRTPTFNIWNSSPRFPIIIPEISYISSIDSEFTYDLSASDPDNDSLVYRLTNAFDGASIACPNPSPGAILPSCPTWASPPPYISVPYIAPYSATNPTNNPLDSGHLRIDSHTGVLSGRVNQTGIFLVAIAADEYRNGRLIGTTMIDFQFTFKSCNTGINGVSANSLLQCYPSPSEGNFTIDMTGYNVGAKQISIYNQLGQVVYQMQSQQDKIQLDSKLQAGVYTVMVTQSGQQTNTRIVIE